MSINIIYIAKKMLIIYKNSRVRPLRRSLMVKMIQTDDRDNLIHYKVIGVSNKK